MILKQIPITNITNDGGTLTVENAVSSVDAIANTQSVADLDSWVVGNRTSGDTYTLSCISSSQIFPYCDKVKIKIVCSYNGSNLGLSTDLEATAVDGTNNYTEPRGLQEIDTSELLSGNIVELETVYEYWRKDFEYTFDVTLNVNLGDAFSELKIYKMWIEYSDTTAINNIPTVVAKNNYDYMSVKIKSIT